MSFTDDNVQDDVPFYHLDDNGQLTWTEEGLCTYRRRFAHFGINIDTVKTRSELKTALQISAAGFTDQLLRGLRDKPQTLERRALIAAVTNSESFPTLLEKLKKRNRLGLRMVSSIQCPEKDFLLNQEKPLLGFSTDID